MKIKLTLFTMLYGSLLIGCFEQETIHQSSSLNTVSTKPRLVDYTEKREPCNHYNPNRIPLFGDTHVHTNLSFDAAAIGIGATPEDAHRFAQGESIDFWPLNANGKPSGRYKIDRPLDFLAVTDHGEFLGERALCSNPSSPKYNSKFCQEYRSNQRQGMILFAQSISAEVPYRIPALCGKDGKLCLEWAITPWQQAIKAAEDAYDRSSTCQFTSFIAYEYTGTPSTSNYHRNVIFRNANVPSKPVSYIEAPIDSQLWQQLDEVCSTKNDCDFLTIPHNSNLANGRMTPYRQIPNTLNSKIAYAKKRQQREPIMEIFQHKGNSECINGLHSILGSADELCDIEAVRTIGENKQYSSLVMNKDGKTVLKNTSKVTTECDGKIDSYGMLGAGCVDPTDYQRSGLLVGLKEERETGFNPIKLGTIAASDTHTGSPGSVVENAWQGHVSGESNPTERLQKGLLTSGIDGNPGGLTGVWAVENSRDAIFDAMQRREVFGTSGPRIAPRFFASWRYDKNLCQQKNFIASAYQQGVPMGADLNSAPGKNAQPVILATALADSNGIGTPLDKLELIKGWVDEQGNMHNEVITIAGGDGKGHQSLCATYRDVQFNPKHSIYYYLRVVELPVKRWHQHDCDTFSEAERPAVCNDKKYNKKVHEMAWSSPIWYRPSH